MSRDDGFRTADVDVGILDDPKFRALVRLTRDEAVVARAVVAYLAVLTASWRSGGRQSLDDAAPVWLTGLDDLQRRLVDVGLLEGDGRIDEHAWDAWFEPARQRQEAARERWRRANQRRSRGGTAEVIPMSPRGDRGGTATSRTAPVRAESEPSRSDRSHSSRARRAPQRGEVASMEVELDG